MSGASEKKFKLSKYKRSDEEDPEVVDLVHEHSPAPYSKVVNRECKKLHNPHSSDQNHDSENSVQLPKISRHFYGNGSHHYPLFMRNSEEDHSISGDSLNEFPSPSAVFKNDEEDIADPFESGLITYQSHLPDSSVQPNELLQSLEDPVLNIDETLLLRPATPKVNASFANRVFNFEAFEDESEEQDMLSSSLIGDLNKRARSSSPENKQAKHRRVSNKEIGANENYIEDKGERTGPASEKVLPGKGSLEEKELQETRQPRAPTWIHEFDSALLNELKDLVDIID
jgi:hypothetical protein